MPLSYALYLSLLSVLASPAMASPVDTLASIQCNCLTFYTYARPVACTINNSQNLTWPVAQSFASAHKLDITFASHTTISRVLQVEQPLPTSVLMSMYGGHGHSRQETGSRVVCGSWDEVNRKFLDKGVQLKTLSVEGTRCDGLLSEIVGILLLILVLYAIAEYAWSRFVTKPSQLQLDGAEKKLIALAETGSIPCPKLSEKSGQVESFTQTNAS